MPLPGAASQTARAPSRPVYSLSGRTAFPFFPSPSGGASLVVALALTLVASLFAPAPAAAQRAQPDSTEMRRFQLASSYLQAGQYERAITLLEDLHAGSPQVYVFYSKLKDAYESVKRYDDAIALVERRMERQRGPVLISEKARLQYLQGDEPAAFKTWDRAIGLAPEQRSSYQVVYQALVDVRHFERAIDVLERGREALGEAQAFQTQIAYLYSLTGRHAQAMREYLELLSDDEQRLSFVRSRLSSFLTQDDALSASVAAAKEAVRQSPLNLSYRELLAWLHMEAKQYADAYNVYRALDRLGEEEGRRLLGFARQAADAEAFETARKALDLILTRYPDAPTAPEALRSLGAVQKQWGDRAGEKATSAEGAQAPAPHYEAAANHYRTYLQRYPNRPAYPVVLRQLGRLQQDVFADLSAADSTLQEVVDRYPDSETANEARYDLGRIAIMRGNLSEARLIFTRLVDQLRTGDLAEQARYEMALLHFYQGEFDAAQTLAEATTSANTSTDVANDAIELKVLLLQNKGPDSLNTALQAYARAKLLDRQRRHEPALAQVDTLLTDLGAHPLADDARFFRAELLRTLGQSEAAFQAFAAFPQTHPQSPLADQSLFEAAALKAEALGAPEEARALYLRLLEEYPSSLLTAKTRARLRLLESPPS